jgi:hypothetical protein
MYRIASLLFACFSTLLCDVSIAATVIKVDVKSARETQHYTLTSNDNWIKVVRVRDLDDKEFLFNVVEQTIYVVNHREHSVISMSETDIDKLGSQISKVMNEVQAKIAATMADMSEAQRSEMEKMFANMDLSTTKPPSAATQSEAKFVSSKNVQTLNGFQCVVGDILENGVVQGDACIATMQTLKIPLRDYANLRSMMAFAQRVSGKLMNILPSSQRIPNYNLTAFDGIPVQIANNSYQFEIKLVSQQPTLELVLPQDYQVKPGFRIK